MSGKEDKIRQRAYELWKQNDKTGSEIDYWLQAEREARRNRQSHRKIELNSGRVAPGRFFVVHVAFPV